MAGLALQMVWGYKDLRRTLEKDGWKKTDFMVNLNAPGNTRANGGYEDSTLLLINNGQGGILYTRTLVERRVCFYSLQHRYLLFSHDLNRRERGQRHDPHE